MGRRSRNAQLGRRTRQRRTSPWHQGQNEKQKAGNCRQIQRRHLADRLRGEADLGIVVMRRLPVIMGMFSWNVVRVVQAGISEMNRAWCLGAIQAKVQMCTAALHHEECQAGHQQQKFAELSHRNRVSPAFIRRQSQRSFATRIASKLEVNVPAAAWRYRSERGIFLDACVEQLSRGSDLDRYRKATRR